MSFSQTLPYVDVEAATAQRHQDSALNARFLSDAELEAAIDRALDECEYESIALADDFVAARSHVDVRFAEGSNAHVMPSPFDEVEQAFFAEGEALCEQHRAEAEELATRQAFGTMMKPWWRRLLSRSRRPEFA